MTSSALNEAVDAAARLTGTSPDEIRAGTEALLHSTNAEDIQGLRDLQNHALSIGLPATRHALRHMAVAADLPPATKAEILAEIKNLSPITEVGCMKIEFFNAKSQKADSAYLRLDQCPRSHNLDTQLDKLRPVVAPEKWARVLWAFSSLLLFGRSVYSNVARQRVDILRKINGLAEDDPCTQWLDFHIDSSNTTLYLDETWPNRIGLFVTLESEE